MGNSSLVMISFSQQKQRTNTSDNQRNGGRRMKARAMAKSWLTRCWISREMETFLRMIRVRTWAYVSQSETVDIRMITTVSRASLTGKHPWPLERRKEGWMGKCVVFERVVLQASVFWLRKFFLTRRPNVKACEQAYDIFGSASELPIEECSETKYEELCTFRAGKNPQTHHLECDWSICFPRRPYIGEVNSTYGIVVRWRYSPSRVMIKEIITRSIKNGFYFVFFKCGGLKQVLKLPHRPKMSPSRKGSKRINVNLILIDSISRPHFYRSMPRSIEALRHVVYNRSIPATVLDFELLQSVSQHTMDNCRPLYSGVTAGEYPPSVPMHTITLIQEGCNAFQARIYL